MRWIIVLFLLFANYITFAEKIDSTKLIIDKMFSNIENIKTLKFFVRNTERINGKLLTGEQLVKYYSSPEKYYIKLIKPVSGPEIIWVKGQNNNYAIYNPNSFPYIKLNLDTDGSLMRKNNHHTIFALSFNFFKDKIERIYLNNFYSFIYNGITIFKDKRFYKVTIDISDYKIVNYTMLKNENISEIALKKGLNEYKILELNPFIDFYDYSNEGKIIKIPNYYAKKIELYIDANSYLPVFQKIYDEIGLFEKYEYLNLELNPKFDSQEFTISYYIQNKLN